SEAAWRQPRRRHRRRGSAPAHHVLVQVVLEGAELVLPLLDGVAFRAQLALQDLPFLGLHLPLQAGLVLGDLLDRVGLLLHLRGVIAGPGQELLVADLLVVVPVHGRQELPVGVGGVVGLLVGALVGAAGARRVVVLLVFLLGVKRLGLDAAEGLGQFRLVEVAVVVRVVELEPGAQLVHVGARARGVWLRSQTALVVGREGQCGQQAHDRDRQNATDQERLTRHAASPYAKRRTPRVSR